MSEDKEKKRTSGFKILIKITAMIVLLGYIIFSFFKENTWTNNSPCPRVIVCIKDSAQATFVSKNDILNILDKKNINPVGIPLNRISLPKIKKEIEQHQFVLDAQCYKTADNAVHIDVSQNLPVLRILSDNGDNYYIDSRGNRMKKVTYPADVIVATGSITPRYAKKHLAALGRIFLHDDFWNNQVDQIHVLKDGSIEMIPRVGNHIIYLGKPQLLADKFNKLKIFYTDVLCRVGWNKYSRINMEYNNQIICVKSE